MKRKYDEGNMRGFEWKMFWLETEDFALKLNYQHNSLVINDVL